MPFMIYWIGIAIQRMYTFSVHVSCQNWFRSFNSYLCVWICSKCEGEWLWDCGHENAFKFSLSSLELVQIEIWMLIFDDRSLSCWLHHCMHMYCTVRCTCMWQYAEMRLNLFRKNTQSHLQIAQFQPNQKEEKIPHAFFTRQHIELFNNWN